MSLSIVLEAGRFALASCCARVAMPSLRAATRSSVFFPGGSFAVGGDIPGVNLDDVARMPGVCENDLVVESEFADRRNLGVGKGVGKFRVISVNVAADFFGAMPFVGASHMMLRII